MAVVTASYLAFSLVVYRWCGQWVASPSLSSAGPALAKAAYGLALPGLLVSAALYLHVAAKYLFVRALRRSAHLQRNSPTHWAVWLGCTLAVGAAAWAVAAGVPVFRFLIALVGSLCFGPLALVLPAGLWLFEARARGGRGAGAGSAARRGVAYGLHWLMALAGAFVTVGGTYAVVGEIRAAYTTGQIDGAFSCADNSGSS